MLHQDELPYLFWSILLTAVFPFDLLWRHQMGERFCSWLKLIAFTFLGRYPMAFVALFTEDFEYPKYRFNHDSPVQFIALLVMAESV